MARNEQARDADQEQSLLDRRGYLKLAGAAAATAASTSALGSDRATAQTDPVFLKENFKDSSYVDWFTRTWRQGEYDSISTEASYTGDTSLRVNIPEDNHYGIALRLDPKKGELIEEQNRQLYASYWVKFGADFQSDTNGGKLPGPKNRERNSGGAAGERIDGTNGWTARGKFAADNGGIVVGYYTYHMDMDGRWGDHINAATVPRDKWVHIEQFVKLNTVTDGSANRDGELKMWVNGERKIDRTNMRYTLYPENGVNYDFTVYYGGSDPSPADNHLYFDKWELATSRPTAGQRNSGNNLELITDEGTDALRYDFTVDGDITKDTIGDKVVAEGNDSLTTNDDGTVTVTGVSSDGRGDGYWVDGTITSMNLDESKWTIRYDGQQVGVNDIVVAGDDSPDTATSANGPSINQFQITKSERLGDDRMFSVNWDVSAADADLDTVEVVVAQGTDINFSVTDVDGQNASNWDLFQFPINTSLQVSLRVTDQAGTVTKKTKDLSL